ncbi:unnamed protein product [Vicia faba]|uniref:Uncharacterized protein n=1 Tax=Vicia faba TaxID=3906 RepID=A0AAV1A9K0_VICFA|nr:unnamed protein product [Vicia faba]
MMRCILEKSLSVDNLFIFVLIFKYFKVPTLYQVMHKPYCQRLLPLLIEFTKWCTFLWYCWCGVVVFRLTIILLGTATIQRFQAVNLLLAEILLFSSFKAYPTVKFADASLSTLKGEVGIIHVHMLIHR